LLCRGRNGPPATWIYRPGEWALSGDLVFARANSSTPTPITRTRLLGPVGQIAFNIGDADGAVPDLNFLTADLNNPALVAKEDLCRRTTVLFRQVDHRVVREYVPIGGERPKALVEDAVLAAKCTDLAVVLGFGIEAVLNHSGLDSRSTV
jgi:hypothetical protein